MRLRTDDNSWFPFGQESPKRSARRNFNLVGQECVSTRSNKFDYKAELDKQVRDTRRRNEQKRQKLTAWENNKHVEIEAYDPWGRPGAGAPCTNQRGEVLSSYGHLKKFSDEMRRNPRISPMKNSSPLKRYNSNFVNSIKTDLSSRRNYISPRNPQLSVKSPTIVNNIGLFEKKLAHKREAQKQWRADLQKQIDEKERRKEQERLIYQETIRKEEIEFEKVRKRMINMPIQNLTAAQKRQTGLAVINRKTPPLNQDSHIDFQNADHISRPPALDQSGIIHCPRQKMNGAEKIRKDEELHEPFLKNSPSYPKISPPPVVSYKSPERKRTQPFFMNPTVSCRKVHKLKEDFFSDILPEKEFFEKINNYDDVKTENEYNAESILRQFMQDEIPHF